MVLRMSTFLPNFNCTKLLSIIFKNNYKNMKKIINCITFLFVSAALFAQSDKVTEIKNIMEKVADWQIENHYKLEYRPKNKRLSRGKHHP